MQNLDPKSVWLFFINYVIRWVSAGFFILFFFGSLFQPLIPNTIQNTFGFALLFIVVVTVLAWAWAKLSYKFYRYELREEGFRKENGVIWKTYVTIPYEKIQNVDIYRGLVARVLGLSDLNIQTAGASAQVSRWGVSGVGAEGRLPGVSFDVAEKLRDELIKRSKGSKSQSL